MAFATSLRWCEYQGSRVFLHFPARNTPRTDALLQGLLVAIVGRSGLGRALAAAAWLHSASVRTLLTAVVAAVAVEAA